MIRFDKVGGVLTVTGNRILPNSSNTCGGSGAQACLGTPDTGPGGRIVLDVAAVPEASQAALLRHRRRQGSRVTERTAA